jgi:predicted house-cleaning noncanonical NTP pyrophosphatase (MazG superfamily)
MPKLVRDLIPSIMRENGVIPKVRTLHDNKEYMRALQEKLLEEMKEYEEDKSLEELADIVEVVEALVEHVRVMNGNKLDRIRSRKREARGGFVSRQYLMEP